MADRVPGDAAGVAVRAVVTGSPEEKPDATGEFDAAESRGRKAERAAAVCAAGYRAAIRGALLAGLGHALDEMMTGGLVTLEKVRVIDYRAAQEGEGAASSNR